ncbi:hypothetical protein ACMU_17925 [Actibacterium mucosum KCTC 23349]|uniref:Endonuclease/exonuclease/phosphatase domain-containing protein n=1 Tax=Actibacterium mucosum KCTC 23349 TaxID=1454373 RepID=A0A037ZID4_9RHOB|nr:endonuclease/exonuclease/phosphatase family protein [Actibacterium mucosum]KAJ54585.1 hypothetical protein ACMU_17925 [Actibacterium mucosum KCTC 23349]
MWQLIVRTGLILVLMAIGGGFLGAVHPVGDSLAAFRMPLCVTAGVLLLLTCRRVWILRIGVPLSVACAWSALPYFAGASLMGQPVLRIYQKNMLWNAQDRSALFADFVSSGADVLTLQEVNARNLASLEVLKDRFPHQLHCDFRFVGGTMVMSRLPIVQTLPCSDGMSAAQVQTPAGPVWVIALHVSWPYPHPQQAHVLRLMSAVAQVEGPVVVAGDFNMAPWGRQIGRLFQQLNVSRITPARGTYALFGFVPLPLDHVHSTLSGELVSVRPKMGADHRGLLVDIGQ